MQTQGLVVRLVRRAAGRRRRRARRCQANSKSQGGKKELHFVTTAIRTKEDSTLRYTDIFQAIASLTLMRASRYGAKQGNERFRPTIIYTSAATPFRHGADTHSFESIPSSFAHRFTLPFVLAHPRAASFDDRQRACPLRRCVL
jgi:hypothetical protein